MKKAVTEGTALPSSHFGGPREEGCQFKATWGALRDSVSKSKAGPCAEGWQSALACEGSCFSLRFQVRLKTFLSLLGIVTNNYLLISAMCL